MMDVDTIEQQPAPSAIDNGEEIDNSETELASKNQETAEVVADIKDDDKDCAQMNTTLDSVPEKPNVLGDTESPSGDRPPRMSTSSVENSSLADVSMESGSGGKMGLRRAKTKGELKKQLELKKGKLRNSLLEINDTESVPSPQSSKQLDNSLVKVPKEIPETQVKWGEGDMFWGRVTGHPWWPCVVFRDPIQSLFTRMMRVNLRAYHFHFFGDSCERGWVVESSLMPYEGKEKFEQVKQEKMALYGNVKVKTKLDRSHKLMAMSFEIKPSRLPAWVQAVEEAEKVVAMTIEERVKFATEAIAASKKKTGRRTSVDGGVKRKKEDQQGGDDPVKKKARKSEGAPKEKTTSVSNHADLKVEDAAAVAKKEDEKDGSVSMDVSNSNCDGQANADLDITAVEAATPAPAATPAVRHSSLIESTPERASATRYKLRAVRKLKKLTDDEGEEENENNKSIKKASSPLEEQEEGGDEDHKCGGDQNDESSTKPNSIGTPGAGGIGSDVVRTLEVFKLSHNNNNYKKEDVCLRCETSAPGIVKCRGPCHAPLHPACVGVEMTKAVEGEEAKEVNFMCDECTSGKHTCFVCKSKEGATVKCSVSSCFFYYHVNCLKKLKYAKFEGKQPICPMHLCSSCASDSEKIQMSGRGRFFKCIRCPKAYHVGDLCIPAGSEVLSSTWIVCSDHHALDSRKKHQDHINVAWCFLCGQGGSLVCCESCPASFHLECCEEPPANEEKWSCELCTDGKRPLYGEIVWCKAGIYRWWPGEICHPRNIPNNIHHLAHGVGDFPVYFFGSNDYLWTHRGRVFSFQEGDKGTKQGHSKHFVGTFNKALEEADNAARVYYEERYKKEQKILDKKPTPYKHVKTNVPVGKVEIYKVPLSEIPRCQCSPEMDVPCGAESDCINRLMMYECDASVCPAGDRCANRSIQLRLDADTEFFKTSDNRGWGLKAKVNIRKGQFIHEYVGDLIDEEECKERLERAKELNITNFYMLTLDKNRIIDAGPKGNNSRFMNHSCQPNCETQKWFVNGDVRIGLFALRDVKADEELNFNYNLECLGDKKTVCHCGAPLCSGYLGERPKSSTADGDKAMLMKKKRKKQKNSVKLTPVHEDTCYRCGNPGELVLCDKVGCTKSYHLQCLKLSNLPKGKWICPWHLCDEENCGKWSSKLCSMCPNSFCSKHAEGNVITLSTGRLVCDEHPMTCPHLQFLLAQDEEALKGGTNGVNGNASSLMNGDEEDSRLEDDSERVVENGQSCIFPLLSTPLPKKGRGRPPKFPKTGVTSSTSKQDVAKTPKSESKAVVVDPALRPSEGVAKVNGSCEMEVDDKMDELTESKEKMEIEEGSNDHRDGKVNTDVSNNATEKLEKENKDDVSPQSLNQSAIVQSSGICVSTPSRKRGRPRKTPGTPTVSEQTQDDTAPPAAPVQQTFFGSLTISHLKPADTAESSTEEVNVSAEQPSNDDVAQISAIDTTPSATDAAVPANTTDETKNTPPAEEDSHSSRSSRKRKLTDDNSKCESPVRTSSRNRDRSKSSTPAGDVVSSPGSAVATPSKEPKTSEVEPAAVTTPTDASMDGGDGSCLRRSVRKRELSGN